MWPTAFALTKLTAVDEGKDRCARVEGGEPRPERQSGPRTGLMILYSSYGELAPTAVSIACRTLPKGQRNSFNISATSPPGQPLLSVPSELGGRVRYSIDQHREGDSSAVRDAVMKLRWVERAPTGTAKHRVRQHRATASESAAGSRRQPKPSSYGSSYLLPPSPLSIKGLVRPRCRRRRRKPFLRD